MLRVLQVFRLLSAEIVKLIKGRLTRAEITPAAVIGVSLEEPLEIGTWGTAAEWAKPSDDINVLATLVIVGSRCLTVLLKPHHAPLNRPPTSLDLVAP